MRLCIALVLCASVAWGDLTGKEQGLVYWCQFDDMTFPVDVVTGATNRPISDAANYVYWQTQRNDVVYGDWRTRTPRGSGCRKFKPWTGSTAGATGLLTGVSGFTMAAWVRPESLGANATADKVSPFVYRSAWDGTNYQAFGFGPYGTNTSGFIMRGTAGGVNTPVGFSAPHDTWTHVAITYDTNTAIINTYKNGNIAENLKSTATAYYKGIVQTGYIGIGYDTARGLVEGFNGYIDDFVIFNRVLAPAEIRALASNKPLPPSGGNNYQQSNRYGVSR